MTRMAGLIRLVSDPYDAAIPARDRDAVSTWIISLLRGYRPLILGTDAGGVRQGYCVSPWLCALDPSLPHVAIPAPLTALRSLRSLSSLSTCVGSRATPLACLLPARSAPSDTSHLTAPTPLTPSDVTNW